MSVSLDLKPIISKSFCSPHLTTLMVRKRPHVVHGGGFVVTDCSTCKAIFTVDGCGIVGAKGELVVRDEDGASTLRILKKGGRAQFLSTGDRWKGYLTNEEEQNKLVFSLKEPRTHLTKNEGIRIYKEGKDHNRDWDFEVNGSFIDRACTINDRRGAVVAQVTMNQKMGSKEFYLVVVQPGYDQAFVVGVISVLDNIHGESTRC